MRRYSLLLAAALPLLSGQAVFPPMIGGDFQFAVLYPCAELDAQGIPLVPQGVSVSLEPVAGGAPIVCIETPLCDTRYEASVKITATGQRESFHGRGFTEPGCTGTISDPSDQTAYTYPGMKPGKAQLEN